MRSGGVGRGVERFGVVGYGRFTIYHSNTSMIWFLLCHIKRITGIRWPYWLYQVYLNSTTWRHKRQQIINRANGRCETCETVTEKFEVHHYDYSNLGNEPEHDLFAICSYCHKKIHNVV